MSVASFTKTGTKATSSVKLDAQVFGNLPKNHVILKTAYLRYLAESRSSSAKTKTRGLVRGGGKKPWRQKGTGRARFGSSRNPIWRGGGIAFGPTGQENYRLTMPLKTKRLALSQALSLVANESKVSTIEDLSLKGKKTQDIAKLLNKLNLNGRILLVIDSIDNSAKLPIRNLANVSLVGAKNLSVFHILNADSILITKPALELISSWLAPQAVKD